LHLHPQVRQTTFVGFRWAADKQLRGGVCNFADDSRHASPRAARLYHDVIARGKDHPHAVPILALR
jgi:transposase